MCYCSRSEICVSEIRRRIRATEKKNFFFPVALILLRIEMTMFSLSDIKQIQEKRNKLDTEHLGQCFGSPGLQLNPVFETLAMLNWSIHYQNSLCDMIRKSRIGPLWSKKITFSLLRSRFLLYFSAQPLVYISLLNEGATFLNNHSFSLLHTTGWDLKPGSVK